MVESDVALTGFARRLVVDGIITDQVAKKTLSLAEENNIPFVSQLIQDKIISAKVVATVASHNFGIPLLDLNTFDADLIPLNLVNHRLIQRHHALPIYQRGKRLYIAISDPTNVRALDEFKFHVGLNAYAVLVEEDKLDKKIEDSLSAHQAAALGGIDDVDLERVEIQASEEESGRQYNESEVDDAPVVRFINKLLLDAIKKGASDIHFEPYEKKFRVRYRQDGILYEIAHPPVNLGRRIAARLKVMSHLDISERRIPQDGHFKMALTKKRIVDFRVSTCPTTSGEKIVIRILDPTNTVMGVDMLGFEDWQKDLYLQSIQNPHGMVLVTGPTGSGKTVTLYTALKNLNVSEKNIATVEDPVEIDLQGINQVSVNLKAGLGFSEALRAFLRQDPDIIMVGEIRDIETAEIAIKAAQTGHLVLSTLHTNSAPETLTRMISMGIPNYNIATSVQLIIAQRLARRLCSHCKKVEDIPEATLVRQGFSKEDMGDLKVYGPVGCDNCTDGYIGRIGVYEMLSVSEEVGKIIMENGSVSKLIQQARKQGYQTLRESGLLKVKMGVTSLEEINRITKD